MARTDLEGRRVGWLDGLRGLAAMQVVLLHYVFAFVPAVGWTYPLPLHDFWWKGLATAPLIFLYDGSSAVYLFFIMSGVALTHAFAAYPFDFPVNVTRRVIRLGLPMAGATFLAAVLYALLPGAHATAGELTHSPWLRGIGPRAISVASIAHQIVFEGLLAGFDGWSLLPAWATKPLNLQESAKAFDTPLWTLHIEFCGSLLVMLLVAVRAMVSRTAYRATWAILGCAFVLSPMSLFIIGHLAADHLRHSRGRVKHTLPGAALLGSGVLLCATQTIPLAATLWKLLPPPPLGIQGDPAILQKTIGAVLVFAGIALLPVLQNQLQSRALRFLGRISFSLYLLHFPLESTTVAACFILLHGAFPASVSLALTCVSGIAVSVMLAVPFERWIDRPSIMLSRRVGWLRSRAATTSPIAALGDLA